VLEPFADNTPLIGAAAPLQFAGFTRASAPRLAQDVDGNLVHLPDPRVEPQLAQGRSQGGVRRHVRAWAGMG
jgi:hypothetical protein